MRKFTTEPNSVLNKLKKKRKKIGSVLLPQKLRSGGTVGTSFTDIKEPKVNMFWNSLTWPVSLRHQSSYSVNNLKEKTWCHITFFTKQWHFYEAFSFKISMCNNSGLYEKSSKKTKWKTRKNMIFQYTRDLFNITWHHTWHRIIFY